MDLKIELRTLLGLHESTIQLEHAVRQTKHLSSEWIPFSSSRFIYAYFTFNSIYSFDWETSFQNNSAEEWGKKTNGKWPKEKEKFTSVIDFYAKTLGSEMSRLHSEELVRVLHILQVDNTEIDLENIKQLKGSNEIKKLKTQFPKNFSILLDPKSVDDNKYKDALLSSLEFIYAVRNNVFHGSKTTIHMWEKSQQRRLLIYCAVLISANALLFKCIKKQNINWNEVSIYLPHERHKESV